MAASLAAAICHDAGNKFPGWGPRVDGRSNLNVDLRGVEVSAVLGRFRVDRLPEEFEAAVPMGDGMETASPRGVGLCVVTVIAVDVLIEAASYWPSARREISMSRWSTSDCESKGDSAAKFNCNSTACYGSRKPLNIMSIA